MTTLSTGKIIKNPSKREYVGRTPKLFYDGNNHFEHKVSYGCEGRSWGGVP